MSDDIPILIGHSQYRDIVVEAYKAKVASWDEAFKELFNAGWRSPFDKYGLPTQRYGIR